jgi:hypothetical protein
MTQLASYTKLLMLSKQMLELAKQQQWESLATMESERAVLLSTIPSTYTALAATEISAIGACIRQIQDCDRVILDYVTPWREHAEKLLSRLES